MGALRDTLLRVPMGTYLSVDLADPTVFLPALLGPGTSVQPYFQISMNRLQQSGWTVLTPTREGVTAFVLPETWVPWATASFEDRVRRLLDAVEEPFDMHATDMTNLVTALFCDTAEFATSHLDPASGYPDAYGDGYESTVSALNGFVALWLLRHACRYVDFASGQMDLLLGLSCTGDAEAVRNLLAVCDVVAGNADLVVNMVSLVQSLVERRSGHRVSEAIASALVGRLAVLPPAQWVEAAEAHLGYVIELHERTPVIATGEREKVTALVGSPPF